MIFGNLYRLFIGSVLLVIPLSLNAQNCHVIPAPKEAKYKAQVKFPNVEANWYPEWIEAGNNSCPEPIPLLDRWEHPYMKNEFAAAMHEDSHASDVSNLRGPTMNNVEVQYFQSRMKGEDFSGMCPSFAFVDEHTLVAPSFGRASTTLLLLDVEDTINILDTLVIPGRINSALDLAKKENRMKLFRETYGGAYFYLSEKNRVYIPGANSKIIRVTIENRRFRKNALEVIDIEEQILAGNTVDPEIVGNDILNRLTALMPDIHGNIWFTSKYGIIGLIHRQDKYKDSLCPKVYASFIGFFGVETKVEKFFHQELSDMKDIPYYTDDMSFSPELRKAFREKYAVDPETREEIQNSFTVGKDGVYINSNLAMYKLYFNEQTKRIELDPKWAETFKKGDLIYDNDHTRKPGHLNRGTGTTPTLMGDDYVVIGDNDTSQINLVIYSQESGELVFKQKIFEPNGSAVENSMVAYNNSIIIGNTYGYVDPFSTNETAGGLIRFDLVNGKFQKRENWPAPGHLDAKTATPKMSAANGMIYVYNRSDSTFNGHHDWQLTAIDYRTGYRVFYIRPYFDKKVFKDNAGLMSKAFSMGNKNYDRKVFNNIWATYTFGPNNSIYIGTYRGFIRFKSD
jgi:hypothetical protein